METKAKNLVLWKNDPVLYFFREKLGFSDLGITLFLTGVAATAVFGLGWIADRSYTGGGSRFIQPQFYSWASVMVFLAGPLWISFYVWQPGAIANVLQSFEQTDVIQEVSEKGSKNANSYSDFLIQFQMAIGSKRWAITAVILAVCFGVLEYLVVFPSFLGTVGRSAFWYDVKWFLIVILLILVGGVYVSCMIVLKQVRTILYFNRLFQRFNVRIHPMHPDEAGGLGALGNFTLKTSLITVGIGVGAAAFSAIGWATGASPFTRPDLLIFWALYILITPTNLMVSMLSAHRAMQEARNERLNEISQEFERTLSDASVTKIKDAEAIKKANEKLKELQTRYNLVAESFPTWPVPARLFRSFSITASLPMVSGLISMAIDFATQK
jgi:hypothetical protein